MSFTKHYSPQKNQIALAILCVLLPGAASALDLAQSPPGSTEPYVRPNVIISIDDSGSMNYRLDKEGTNGDGSLTTPNADGSWSVNSRRINVLKYSLKSIFDPSHEKFDSGFLPDGKIRLAWQVMHNNGKSADAKSVNPSGTGAPGLNTNSMRILKDAHRTNFLNFVTKLSASGGTPSHGMLEQADKYMRRPLGKNGPWSSNPGGNDDKSTEYLGCRKNYHIFMTDGRWNGDPSGGSYDDNNRNITLPDGEIYGSESTATRPYNNLYSDSHSETLADLAFYSWSNPLQTSGLTGTMKTTSDYNKSPSTETFGKDAKGNNATLSRYWNPRYNPATWPHMVTYTIGFSKMAYQWDYSAIKAPSQMLPFGYDGSFPDLVTGNVTWPELTKKTESKNALDLWHAALNGRGRFYAVEKGEDLEKAFRDIFDLITSDVEPDLSSSATSGSNITRTGVDRFVSVFEPKDQWKGYVKAETIKPNGDIVAAEGWGGNNTAKKIDTLGANARTILSWSDQVVSNKEKGGVAFRWSSDEKYLSASQKTALQKHMNGTSDGKGEQRLAYVRGDRSNEGVDATALRQRSSAQGDIINSNIWFTGVPSSGYALKGYAKFTLDNIERPKMIYVGGNDGMLHGFAAADGAEKIAYVPKGVIPTLNRLTDPTFNDNHRFFVDGSPMTGDVDLGMINKTGDSDNTYTPDWRTMLVGTLGNGGKGFFVLDVTKPADFAENKANTLAVVDRTQSAATSPADCSLLSGAAKATCDEAADIGHIVAQPVLDPINPMRTMQIVLMNNNRWAVVLGNGYNSARQRPVLLIQYLDGDYGLVRLPATNDTAGQGKAKDNGLAAPRLVDLNGDGRMDIAYAGDNLGNLWKFDLTSPNESDWQVVGSGTPLFTAQGPAGPGTRNKTQPITAAPTVRANDRYSCEMENKICKTGTTKAVGGVMVAFGTGRNITQDDPNSNDVQTLYSVLDSARYEFDTNTKRLKIKTAGDAVQMGDLAQQKFVELENGDRIEPVDELNKDSWRTKKGWYLDLPAVGERLLKPMELYQNSNLLVVYSQAPAKGKPAKVTDKDKDSDTEEIESCEAVVADEERQWRTFVNIMDGKRPSVQLVDADGDGAFFTSFDDDGNPDGGDRGISRIQVTKGAHNIIKGSDSASGGCLSMDVDIKGNKESLACMPEISMRPSWRQYQ